MDTDNKIQPATEEDKHVSQYVVANNQKYRLTPKYLLWEKYFLDKNNKETYGNATQSAIKAYNLTDEQYNVARLMGCENIAKHNNLMAKYYEGKGKSIGSLYDLFWEMMLARKDVNMLYSIAEAFGVKMPEYKPLDKPQYVLNQQNNQVNIGGDMSLTFIKEGEQQPDAS